MIGPSRPSKVQFGFSLVEILLVLAIIALLSVAAFIVLFQVREANAANTETQRLTTIIVGVRNLFGGQADYSGLTTGIANQARVFPRSMNGGSYLPDQPIYHVADGEVEIEPRDAGNKRFAVVYRDTPAWLCVKMAQNYGKNVDEVLVGGVHVKNFGDIGSDPEDTLLECNREPLSDVEFIQK